MSDPPRSDTRTTIVEVAARLLAEHGEAALTTRGVAHAAGVQAPAIYRLFGDKDGLLDAVAEHVMATYVASKSATAESESEVAGDPIAELRAGWNLHVEFGLANPTLFRLLNVPGWGRQSPATTSGIEILRSRVHRVASAGRLRVSEERAVNLIHAAGTGAVLALLAMPDSERDPGLADAMYDAVSHAMLTEARAFDTREKEARDEVQAATVTFRTLVPRLSKLSDSERTLMTEWLDRAVE
ncbi:TetR/AcrR family transcriptional regulator [Spelaeicoccus albus]|uniref:AcrR family transcriptional regulator n=1 Tax=Spelaeicoccus albus TaxID=1280376 RepID=A0A7Z0D1X3_9MICO|nr:TetR/AcrR family transcriptional regulator [Spelaeicoccus albus]NYI67137.1 AcrR family transcriptional regulator [Spelaeicoccus albus]